MLWDDQEIVALVNVIKMLKWKYWATILPVLKFDFQGKLNKIQIAQLWITSSLHCIQKEKN